MLNLYPLEDGPAKVADWTQIVDHATAVAALRGTISIIGFELSEKNLDLERIDALAESIQKGTARVKELHNEH